MHLLLQLANQLQLQLAIHVHQRLSEKVCWPSCMHARRLAAVLQHQPRAAAMQLQPQHPVLHQLQLLVQSQHLVQLQHQAAAMQIHVPSQLVQRCSQVCLPSARPVVLAARLQPLLAAAMQLQPQSLLLQLAVANKLPTYQTRTG